MVNSGLAIEESIKVIGKVDLSILSIDKATQNSIENLSRNIDTLTELVVKSEKTLKIFVYCASFSIVVLSFSSLVQSISNFKNRNK